MTSSREQYLAYIQVPRELFKEQTSLNVSSSYVEIVSRNRDQDEFIHNKYGVALARALGEN